MTVPPTVFALLMIAALTCAAAAGLHRHALETVYADDSMRAAELLALFARLAGACAVACASLLRPGEAGTALTYAMTGVIWGCSRFIGHTRYQPLTPDPTATGADSWTTTPPRTNPRPRRSATSTGHRSGTYRSSTTTRPRASTGRRG